MSNEKRAKQIGELRALVALANAGGDEPNAGGVGALIESPNLATPAQQAAQAQPIWYVDPADSSGFASDKNDGLTPTTPLATIAQILLRWGTSQPAISVDTILVLLSGDAGYADQLRINPIRLNGANFFVLGTLTQVYPPVAGTFDVISQYANVNRLTPATAQGGVQTDAVFAGTSLTNFAPYQNCLVHDVTQDAWFWIKTQKAGATASIVVTAGPTVTLSGFGLDTFTAADVGTTVTISGAATSFNNGPQTIAGVGVGGTSVTLTPYAGAATDANNTLIQWQASNLPGTIAGAPAIIITPPMANMWGAGSGIVNPTPAQAIAGAYANQINSPAPHVPANKGAVVAAGDQYVIYQPSRVYLRTVSPTIDSTVPIVAPGGSFLLNLWATSYNPIPGSTVLLQNGYSNSWLNSTQGMQAQIDSFGIQPFNPTSGNWVNCNFTGGAQMTQTRIYGGHVGSTTGFGFLVGGVSPDALGVTIDGDTIVDTTVMVVRATLIIGTAHFAGLGNGVGVFARDGALVDITPNGVGVFYTTGGAGYNLGCQYWGVQWRATNDSHLAINNTMGTTATSALLITSATPVLLDGLFAPGSILSMYGVASALVPSSGTGGTASATDVNGNQTFTFTPPAETSGQVFTGADIGQTIVITGGNPLNDVTGPIVSVTGNTVTVHNPGGVVDNVGPYTGTVSVAVGGTAAAPVAGVQAFTFLPAAGGTKITIQNVGETFVPTGGVAANRGFFPIVSVAPNVVNVLNPSGVADAGPYAANVNVGVWAPGVSLASLANLVAMLDSAGAGVTNAIQNPQTGSRILCNGNNSPP